MISAHGTDYFLEVGMTIACSCRGDVFVFVSCPQAALHQSTSAAVRQPKPSPSLARYRCVIFDMISSQPTYDINTSLNPKRRAVAKLTALRLCNLSTSNRGQLSVLRVEIIMNGAKHPRHPSLFYSLLTPAKSRGFLLSD